ncbi:MAG: methyltransferase [Balneolaceae bacterium]
MSKIAYDPVKNRFARLIRRSPLLHRIFYWLLDLFFLRSWYIRRELKTVGQKLDREGPWTLLDAGSGFGQYDRFLLHHFQNLTIVAIDLKEEYLQDCKNYFREEINTGRISFSKQDLVELKVDSLYDLVLCVDVLEHIENDQRVFRNLSGALKQGGTLIMHSPSHYSEEDAAEEDSFVEEHARAGYSPRDLTKKLSEAGFMPSKVRYTYGRYGHLSWIWSVKYPMIWLTRFGMSALFILLFYYPVVLPVCLLLNLLDLNSSKEKGYGIYGVGIKK